MSTGFWCLAVATVLLGWQNMTFAGDTVTGDGPLGPWVEVSAAPAAVSRPAGAVVDGLFFVIGGESTGGGRLGLVQIYDPDADEWDSVSAPAMPMPASNLCAGVVDGRIYVPGGWTGSVVLDSLQVLDVATLTWEVVASDPMPGARYGAGCAAHEGRLYVFGGWDGSAGTATTYVYDPTASSGSRWTTMQSSGFAHVYTAALSMNGLIFVAGFSDNLGGNFATVAAFDPDLDAWVDYPALDTPRGGAGMWALGNTLYVGAGGWSSYLTSVEAYDTSLGTEGSWQASEPMNLGRRTFGFATDDENGRLYAATGWAAGFIDHAESRQPAPTAVFKDGFESPPLP
ncbi:MAG TPA: kelch repeat-containing protein [Xanthomonadaceae bacterium]|nr:kelch repeat-containing protein [Xanthomonadaceae bacterium]